MCEMSCVLPQTGWQLNGLRRFDYRVRTACPHIIRALLCALSEITFFEQYENLQPRAVSFSATELLPNSANGFLSLIRGNYLSHAVRFSRFYNV